MKKNVSRKKTEKKIKLEENEVHHCLWSTVHKVSLFGVHGFGFKGEKKAGVISCVLPQTSGRALLLFRWQTPQRSLSLL